MTPIATCIEERAQMIRRYTEDTDWQEMNGGDLVDIKPVDFLNASSRALLEAVCEMAEGIKIIVIPEDIEITPHTKIKKTTSEYRRGYSSALSDIIAAIRLEADKIPD